MIPKSLHTVTVLVAVAQHLASRDSYFANPQHAAAAIDCAAAILGYAGANDVHGLRAAAIRKLEKASAPAPRAARPMPGAAVMDAGREF